MGVNIYTGKGFKNPEERGEFGSFVQELIARYGESDIQYYVIGEIDVLSAKLDLLLITQKSLIIADFKKLTAATKDIASKVHLRGKQNGPWEYVLPNGKTCTMGGSGKKDNPYQQLESFRHEFAEWLASNSQSILGKPVKKADFMNMLGAWAVIDPGFDENLKDLALPWDEIHDRRSWFKIIPLEKLAWEFNCCSTMADGLSIGAIEGIIKLLGANAINLDEILPLPPTAPDPIFSQPHIYGNLVDRHDECTKLSSLIKDEKVSVISIRGLGGVG
jgi:hypothetical protein